MLPLKWTIVTGLLLTGLPGYGPASANGSEAGPAKELVWSQSDGLRREIFNSSLQEGEWTPPVQVTDSNANKYHPVLDVAPDGTKWLFWSAVASDGISVAYSTKQGQSWTEPAHLPFEQTSSITPSVLVDDNGVVWLVWAGNEGGLDDIYCSRLINAKWQQPELINAANEVPDIKPEIRKNAQGVIEVVWQGYRDGAYRLLAASPTNTGWSVERFVAEEETKTKEEEMGLPGFLPADSQFYLKVY